MNINERYNKLLRSIENHELAIISLDRDIQNLQSLCSHPDVELRRTCRTVVEKICTTCGYKTT